MTRNTFYGVLAVLLWYQAQLPVPLVLLILTAIYAVFGGYSYIRIVALTLKRDLT